MWWYKKKPKSEVTQLPPKEEPLANEVADEPKILPLTEKQVRLKKYFMNGEQQSISDKELREKEFNESKAKYQKLYDDVLCVIPNDVATINVYDEIISIAPVKSNCRGLELLFHGSGFRLSNVTPSATWIQKPWEEEYVLTFSCVEQLMTFLGYWLDSNDVIKSAEYSRCVCVVYDADDGEIIKTINIENPNEETQD